MNVFRISYFVFRGSLFLLFLLPAACCLLPACFAWAQETTTASVSPEAQRLIDQFEIDDPYLRRQAFLQLEALREPATASVIRQYLAHRQPELRALGVRALAAVEGLHAVPTLVERLTKDRSPSVRLQAILALEPFVAQDASSVPPLIKALRDRHAEVRMAAIDVVSRIETAEAQEAIAIRWKRERHRDVRRVLEAAMKRLGKL